MRSSKKNCKQQKSKIVRQYFLAAVLVSCIAYAQPKAPAVLGVDAVEMTVGDMDQSVHFYSAVLAFEKIDDVRINRPDLQKLEGVSNTRIRIVRMRLGNESIELTQYLTERGKPIPPDSHSNDGWFQHIAIIVSDMKQAYKVLETNHAQHISTTPQRLPDWNKEAGGIEAYYFKDPDGHPLEILHFPPGKGDPKWQEPRGRLFLGIDHTAIAVRNTDASLRFYRDLLGFHIAGTSDNYGIEQERLSGVPGAHVKITSLRASSGPGIELLQYLKPQNGRPAPADEHSNDIIHHETEIVTSTLELIAKRLQAAHLPMISAGVITIKTETGYQKALLVRDPDGHAVRLVEK